MVRKKVSLDSADVRIVQQVGLLGDGKEVCEDGFFTQAGLIVDGKSARQVLAEVLNSCVNATNKIQGSGSTLTGVIVKKDKTLHVAHLGDSPVFLVRHNPHTHDVQMYQFTKDHNASNPVEAQKVRDNGGRVSRGRVRGIEDKPGYGIAVTRGCGDSDYPGILREPDVLGPVTLGGVQDDGYNAYILVTSDGVFTGNYDIRRYKAYLKRESRISNGNIDIPCLIKDYAVGTLESEDDVTVLSYLLPRASMGCDVFMAVSDGHGGRQTVDTVLGVMEKMVSEFIPSVSSVKGSKLKSKRMLNL